MFPVSRFKELMLQALSRLGLMVPLSKSLGLLVLLFFALAAPAQALPSCETSYEPSNLAVTPAGPGAATISWEYKEPKGGLEKQTAILWEAGKSLADGHATVSQIGSAPRSQTDTGLAESTEYGAAITSYYATCETWTVWNLEGNRTQWVPPKVLTWYWQLGGGALPALAGSEEPAKATAWDVDGFERSASLVSELHADKHKAICYIDVGTAENWRPDYSEFPASVLGKSNGWPGERYLNIADTSVIEPIMAARFQMCREKGFDAVEPDNMDTWEEGSKTGFPLTAAESNTYDEWIAGDVHSLGMAVLQKNDGEEAGTLKSHFDGALTEECNVYEECSNFTPYLAEGKPVLNAEYGSSDAFCAADNAAGIMGARFDLELDGEVYEPCW
jgi:hypothetical protein